MIIINSDAITCLMYQFISVHTGSIRCDNMSDAIFIDINNSFIDINKDGVSGHLYWYQ